MILPGAGRGHAAGGRLAGQEHAADVGLHHAVPLLDRHVEDGRVRIDAGVGHRHGDGPERFLRLRREVGDRRRVADVHDLREDAAAQRGGGALQRRLAQVPERHPGAGLVEGAGDGLPDPGPGAGDEHHVALEVEAHGCFSCHCATSSQRREPDAPLATHEADEILDELHPRGPAADEGMAGQHEAAVLAVHGDELLAPHLQHPGRVGDGVAGAVDVPEQRRVVHDPLHGDLGQRPRRRVEPVRHVVAHQRAVVAEAVAS